MPRHLRREVAERSSTPTGQVLLPLDEDAAAPSWPASWSNARRRGDRDLLPAQPTATAPTSGAPGDPRASAYPALPVTLSSEVAPEIREFERASTRCANAYVQPLMRALSRAAARTGSPGWASTAGAMSCCPAAASRPSGRQARIPDPHDRVGPAAGAMAASLLAGSPGARPLVSFDMGGTTAKMCLIENGAPDQQPRVRGRPRPPLRQGLRPAAQGAGRRHDRDRRRRRLDRPRSRAAGPDEGRAATAPAPSRARSAMASAGPSRRSPTPTCCSAGSTPTISSAAR